MGLSVQAQGIYQFSDPGFEDWDSSNEPGKGWTSFGSARTSDLGIMGSIAKSSAPKPAKAEGHNSATAVMIKSVSAVGVNANGNITTGQINMGSTTPTNAKNYNFTNLSDAAHHTVFAGTPDAVGFYAKFKSGGSPNGRAQFILHDECEYRDPELDSQADNRVGKATILIPACSEWTYFEGAFAYDRTTKPDVQYLLGSFTTNPTPGGSKNDELTIDDIRFVYYHALESVSYDGKAVTFDANGFCDFGSTTYDASKSLTYTKKGVGATVEKVYDAATAVLTITVKGNDYPVNAGSVTTYRIQFFAQPVVTEPTDERVMSLADIDENKAYLLYNEAYTAYAIYNEAAGENLWVAGMKSGDSQHTVCNSDYSLPVNTADAGSSWTISAKDGRYYLYNIGAQKYLTTPGADGSCTFSSEPVGLTAVDLGDGNFAFSATDGELDFMCAAPQLTTPISTWATSDAGSAWQLIVNPNIEVVRPLGEKLSSLDAIDFTKTYVLYNETYTAYAIYNETAGDKLWTAGMKGDDDGHVLKDADYSKPVDLADAGSSWMIYEQEGSFYLYNMGAKKYLTTPADNSGCTFSSEPVALKIVDLGDGNFAISATDEQTGFMCAAPQREVPIATWESSDAGAAWQFIVNPNVQPDSEILPPPAPNADIAGLVVNGEDIFAEGTTLFSITGNYDAEQFVVMLPEGSLAEVSDVAYDRFNRVATFTVTDRDVTNTYTVKFDVPALDRDAVYQLPNVGFEESWLHDNEPGNGWNSFVSACGSLGMLSAMAHSNLAKSEGYESETAAVLSSKNLWVTNANGNLTTGIINMGSPTPTDAANFNFTDRGDAGHSLLFAGRPDAVSFRAKFKSGGSPNGRGQFILHGDVNYCDPEVESQAEYKVGIASVLVPEAKEWTLFTGEFEYLREQPDTQYLLASFTTNPQPGGSAGDSLWVDDVRLVYYHSLSALAYEGAEIEFDENTLAYEIVGIDYAPERLSYTKKGVGATVETAYDADAAVLTITVKGNDFAVNPESVTTYEVAFRAYPTGIDAASVAGTSAEVYTVSGVKVSAADKLPAGVYIVNGKKIVVGR